MTREVQAVGLAGLEGPHHVGVLQLHGELGLAFEAGQHFRLLGPGRRQHLDGDHLPGRVHGLEHAGHPAPAEPIEDLVLVEEKIVGTSLEQQRRPGTR